MSPPKYNRPQTDTSRAYTGMYEEKFTDLYVNLYNLHKGIIFRNNVSVRFPRLPSFLVEFFVSFFCTIPNVLVAVLLKNERKKQDYSGSARPITNVISPLDFRCIRVCNSPVAWSHHPASALERRTTCSSNFMPTSRKIDLNKPAK